MKEMKEMKKIFLALFVSFLALRVFAIEAKVVSVTGKVQVQVGSEWKNLNVGDTLKKGDMIQTGFKSEAVIALTSGNENSKITVSQLSRLTVEQLAEDSSGDRTSVYLTTGSVKSEIKKTEDHRANYSVRSPVATASVRGTELTVTNSFLSSQIETHQGVVETFKTPSDMKNPVVVSDGDSKDESRLFENQKTVAVTKGQSTSFSAAGQTSPRDSAVNRTSMLNSSTESLQFAEAVVTAPAGETSYPVRTSGKEYGSISVEVTLQE
ncbi:MAG: FecR domain-containing protein [Treponema sp.]